MSTQTIDWSAVAPPLVLAVAALVVLLVDTFAGPPRTRLAALVPAGLTVVAVVVSAAGAVRLVGTSRETFCIRADVPGPVPCSFGVNPFTLAFWAVVLFGTVMVALIGTVAVAEGRTPLGEWHFLLLCSSTGAMTLAASRDLITLVVALEVVSLPAFAMVGLRVGDPRAAESAVKFFLVSVVSTAVTLMGVSLLYGATGSVFLGRIDAVLPLAGELGPVAVTGGMLTLVGLAFKVAAVPFHMWVPDTYVGAPVAVAAYLSVVSKAAGFVGLILVLEGGMSSLVDTWSPVLGVLAAATMTVGNLSALRQQHAVRLLAWSSVAQAGYVLVPLGTGLEAPRAVGASISYLAVYAVVNLGAFAVVALVGTRHPGQRLEDYRGLVREEPGAGWPMAFALLALAGLPPGVIGLLAKVVVLDAAAGPATWLAVVMAVNVAIGLVYYLRWLVQLFRPAEQAGASRYDVPNPLAVAIGMSAAAGVVFSVVPGWLLDPLMSVLG